MIRPTSCAQPSESELMEQARAALQCRQANPPSGAAPIIRQSEQARTFEALPQKNKCTEFAITASLHLRPDRHRCAHSCLYNYPHRYPLSKRIS